MMPGELFGHEAPPPAKAAPPVLQPTLAPNPAAATDTTNAGTPVAPGSETKPKP